MTYHDAEVLSAVLDARGHRTDVERYAQGGWRVLLRCGCSWEEAREGYCPASDTGGGAYG